MASSNHNKGPNMEVKLTLPLSRIVSGKGVGLPAKRLWAQTTVTTPVDTLEQDVLTPTCL